MSSTTKVKANISKELNLVLKNAASEYTLNDCLSSETTQTLCNVVEAIFIHGLKDPFFLKGSRYAKYPEPNFWPFLYRYAHSSVKNQIDGLKQIKTEVGKARAWIRIVLNESSMGHYLRLFNRDPSSLSTFYHKSAYLRDFDHFNELTGYMKGIEKMKIQAPVNSSFLNAWTPTPLILSGLVSGRPARLEQLRPRRRPISSSESLEAEEVGESALDLIEGDSASSPFRPYSRGFCSGDDDEVSSVYSHPSMVDGGILHVVNYPLSSTPENDFISNEVPEDRAFTADSLKVDVQRRKHRARRTSKSSSDGSHSRSSSSSNLISAAHRQGSVEASQSSSFQPIPSVTAEITTLPSNEVEKKPEVGARDADPGKEAKQNQNAGEFEVEAGNSTAEEKSSSEQNKEDMESSMDNVGEVSGDSGVASTPTQHAENHIQVTVNAENEALSRKSPNVEAGTNAQSEPVAINVKSEHANTSEILSPASEMSALSLHDELILAGGSAGNSLLGKGWAVHPPVNSQDWDQSGLSSSTGTNSSCNFDSMIRNAINGYESDALETRVRSRLDSERFTETFNDDVVNGIEIGRASVMETADQGSFVTAVTMPQHIKDRCSRRKESSASEAATISEDEQNEQDEYGISREMIPLLTTIPQEKGLMEQKFRCAACNRSIGPTFASYRMCALDAKYYCDGCWRKDDVSVIPSRLIHNWDSKVRPVCRANMSFIRAVEDRPIIRMDQINPALYEHCAVMGRIKFLRGKLALAVMYLLSCRQSVAEDLRLRLWPKEYLYSDIHLYSFSDLKCALSGHLERHLNSIINYAIDHIFNCKLCVQKGFLCEVCSSREVIYPFQVETTTRCTACYSVYHKNCLDGKRCPKCVRREKYAHRPSIPDDHLLLDQ